MRNPNKLPQTINLPPIIISTKPPLPPLPTGPSRPAPGYTAIPLPWNGKVVEAGQMKKLFNQKNIKHPDQTIPVIVAIANQQQRIEQSYSAHLPLLLPELDQEIAVGVGPEKSSVLERYKSQKTTIEKLLELKKAELKQNTATANRFYGRPPFNKGIGHNAVDFVNIFHRSRSPALTTYNDWLTSITAAYTAKMLAAKTKILAEKSTKLTSTIATTEAEEKQRYVATWTSRYNKEKSAIVDQYNLDKTNLDKTIQAELDAIDNSLNSSSGLSAEQKLNKIIPLIKKLRDEKQRQLQQYQSILAGYPGSNFKSRDSKAFLERTRINHLDPETSLQQETAAINAAYRCDVLDAEISKLKVRLVELFAQHIKLIEERAASGAPPLSPPDVVTTENMKEARRLKDFSRASVGGDAVVLGVFYTKVRNKGQWDYKQRGKEFEEFGNFNYGATGTAAGISEQILLRAAGAAQSIAGTSKEEFGKWWLESPYGDDEIDQIWIRAGINYAKNSGF